MDMAEMETVLSRYYNAPPMQLIEELTNIVNEALESSTCNECGCTEYLCGCNRRG